MTQPGKDPGKIFPHLNQIYKSKFPFRLSVPSFVYPADYAVNVRHLRIYVDEIELLFFESDERSMPTAAQIRELEQLAIPSNLSYNVHLPLDLDLGAPEDAIRHHAIERLISLIDRVKPLSPTTHTLHLPCRETAPDPGRIESWQQRTRESLRVLMGASNLPSRSISIETLDYPPAWLVPVVEDLDLSVCVDIGHLLLHGFHLNDALETFAPRIAILHVHGAADGKDHLGLVHLDTTARKILGQYLRGFKGSVSLEVFSFERLRDSLPILESIMTGMDLS